MPRPANSGDWAALFVLTLLWGSAFAFNKLALVSFSPATIVFGRVLVASLVLYAFLRARGARLPTSVRAWVPMAVMAVLGNLLPFQLVASAQQHIDSSVAGVLMAIMPLFMLTLAHFFVPGSRLTSNRIAGFLIGFSGVAAVIGPATLPGLQGNAALWGALAVLAAALSYAINSIYARRIGLSDPIRLSAGMLLVGSILSLPPAAFDVPTMAPPGLAAVASILVLGLLSTGFATVLYFRIIQGPGPTFLSLVNYLVPAWAVIAGALFLDEALSVSVYIGLALILSGIAVSEFGPRMMAAILSFARLRSGSFTARVTAEDL